MAAESSILDSRFNRCEHPACDRKAWWVERGVNGETLLCFRVRNCGKKTRVVKISAAQFEEIVRGGGGR